MADTYMYIIHEPDWDSDAFLPGAEAPAEEGPMGKDPNQVGNDDTEMGFPAHKAFQEAVTALGARVVGGAALTNSKYGGTVRGDVYTDGPFTDTAEVVSGFYLVETDDESLARKVASMVPTGGSIEWRKVFPT